MTQTINVQITPQKKSFIAVEEHQADAGFNIWSEIIADSCVHDLYTQDYHRVYQKSIIPENDQYFVYLDETTSKVECGISKPNGRFIEMIRIRKDNAFGNEPQMIGKFWNFWVGTQGGDEARYGLVSTSSNLQNATSVVDNIPAYIQIFFQ